VSSALHCVLLYHRLDDCMQAVYEQQTLKSVRRRTRCPASMPFWLHLNWSHDTWPAKFGRLAYHANTFFSVPSYLPSRSYKQYTECDIADTVDCKSQGTPSSR